MMKINKMLVKVVVSVVIVMLLGGNVAFARPHTKGPYFDIGITSGGIQGNIGYKYHLFPYSILDLAVFSEITGVWYFPGYIIALSPGVCLYGAGGEYYGASIGYYMSHFSRIGYSLFTGLDLNASKDNRSLFFESGWHFLDASGYFYLSIGLKWNN